MTCKNCGKEVPDKALLTPDNFPGEGYYEYCDKECYRKVNR